MAKKNVEEVEAQLNNESEGTQAQNQEQEAQVTTTPIKNVKIHTLEEVNCYIGGAHY